MRHFVEAAGELAALVVRLVDLFARLGFLDPGFCDTSRRARTSGDARDQYPHDPGEPASGTLAP